MGPSGGHCLPLEHLRRFARLIVLEPDPLARSILQARLPGVRFELEHRDLLLEPLLSGAPGLDAVLQRRPHCSLLFCNLLGQVQLELPDEQRARFEAEFKRRVLPALAGRSWASFHDRWSLDRAAREPAPCSRRFERRPSDEELGVAWFGAEGAPIIAFEHDASRLFPESWPRSYFSWQLTPKALHVVEALAGAPGRQLGSAS